MRVRVLVAVAFVALVSPCAGQEFADFLPAAAAEVRPAVGRAAATRAAVLVGADRYARLSAADQHLPTARATAEGLARGLRLHAGFAAETLTVVLSERVHEQEVRAAILAAGQQIQTSDDGLLLVAWAGHGWTRHVAGARATEQVLLTHYSEEHGDDFSNGIALDQLVQWLSAARAEAGKRGVQLKPTLVIDACRVGRGKPPPRVEAIPLAAWQVFGSRQGQMVAVGQGDEPFLFTGSLLASLERFAVRGGVAVLPEVFNSCREATLTMSKRAQDPELLAPSDRDLKTAGAPALVVPRRVALSVRCVDQLAGTPIAAATVRVNDVEVSIRDGAGQVFVAPGRAVVTARAEGCLGRADEIDLAGIDAGAEVVLRLVPYVAVVRGRLSPEVPATVVAVGGADPRPGFHRVEQVVRDGTFELRLPSLAGVDLRIRQHGRDLQRFALPARPGGFLRDPGRTFDNVPLVEVRCRLEDATVREFGTGAPESAPPAESTLGTGNQRPARAEPSLDVAGASRRDDPSRIEAAEGERPSDESTIRWQVIPSRASLRPTLADWVCVVLDDAEGHLTGYPRRVQDKASGIVFVLVEPGEFRRGAYQIWVRGASGVEPPRGYHAPAIQAADEGHAHVVRITRPFYLAETETTQAQWVGLMGTNPSRFRGERRPVEQVSWEDAWQFLRKLNGGGSLPFRLPTEAEWEYACARGTSSYALQGPFSTRDANFDGTEPWGEDVRPTDYRGQTVDVAIFKPSPWGLFDMHGNVCEWCQDWYDPRYYAACISGVDDPVGPPSGTSRVVRGGSWYDDVECLRSGARADSAANARTSDLGFRVVRVLGD